MSYQSPWRNASSAPPSRDQQYTSSRGSAGRGGRGGFRGGMRGGYQQPSQPEQADRDFFEGLGREPLLSFDIPRVDGTSPPVKITELEFIGSYNWANEDVDGKPTILVPGSPPQWRSRPLPYAIAADVGRHVSDRNGDKIPKAPLLPLFAAVDKFTKMENKKKFDWPSVDIITDRNNLRKLTRWVSAIPEIPGKEAKDFRIDLQLLGEKTVVMSRWSETYAHVFNGYTYGFSFEKESTTPAPGCADTSSHHRVMAYNLNGLKVVVRCEVDACIPPPKAATSKSKSSVDDLVDGLSGMSIAQTTFQSEYPIIVREGGKEISAASVLELTTRSQKSIQTREFDWDDAYPQLFFSKTANHYIGVHKFGEFSEIKKRKTDSSELQSVENRLQPSFMKVRAILDVIKKVVIKHGKDVHLSLVCQNGSLRLYERTTGAVLPSVISDLFEFRDSKKSPKSSKV